jgi:hypothetical protein
VLAVELRLGEIRAGQLQDLVGLAQLADLALQFLDALLLGRRRAGPLADCVFQPIVDGISG